MTLTKQIALVLAVALATTSLEIPQAQAQASQETQASNISPELQEYLNKDIKRMRAEITLQQAGVAEFQKVLKSAKIQRTVSIVLNTAQVVAAAYLTRRYLQNFMSSQTNAIFTITPLATAVGDAIYAVSVNFRNVERAQTMLDEASQRLEQDQQEVNELQASFSRLGPDGKAYLKDLATQRATAIATARGKLGEMQIELEAARLDKNRATAIKWVGNIAAILGAIGSIAVFSHATKAMSVNSTAGIYWYSVGALSAGTSYTIFDFVGKYAGISKAEYLALKRRVDDLTTGLAAEEQSQRRFAELLTP